MEVAFIEHKAYANFVVAESQSRKLGAKKNGNTTQQDSPLFKPTVPGKRATREVFHSY